MNQQVESYHFISKDPVDSVLIKGNEPVQSTDLVVSQFAIFHIC